MIIDKKDTDFNEHVRRVKKIIGNNELYAYVLTFGCQQNEADSEKIRGIAKEMGYKITDTPENASLIIVNTCAIREHAEQKAFSTIGNFKALKQENPSLIIGLAGCMAAQSRIADTVKKKFRHISFTLEPNMLHRLPALVAKYMEENERSFVFEEDRGDIIEGLPTSRASGNRAWVSVMYGCNNFCSYCIVPYTRGRERSRPSEEILAECTDLVRSGVREITLLGQNVNSYKADMDFAELISKIAKIEGDFIIRFMTSHPKDTSDKLIEAIAAHREKIAPYFHLPLQSGSDNILKKMNRSYTKERYLSVVKKLRDAIPGIAISTDIIVGFPGESEEDFLETMSVLSQVRFDLVYSFIYSKRTGTRAADMENQVEEEIKKERLSRLLKLQDGISLEKNEPLLNSKQRVLVYNSEIKNEKLIYVARTYTNKLVHFEATDAVIGEFSNVKINKVGPFILSGVQLKQ